MNHRWLKYTLGIIAVLFILGVCALEILHSIAENQGVTAVSLPSGSEIEKLASKADYVDAYKVMVKKAAVPDTLHVVSFGEVREVAKTGQEIVVEGSAPGLRFLVSYHSVPGNPPHATFSTAVFYKSIIGRIYFFFVKPIHRRMVPFMVSQTIGKTSIQ